METDSLKVYDFLGSFKEREEGKLKNKEIFLKNFNFRLYFYVLSSFPHHEHRFYYSFIGLNYVRLSIVWLG